MKEIIEWIEILLPFKLQASIEIVHEFTEVMRLKGPGRGSSG